MKNEKYFLLQDKIHTYLDLFLNGYSLTKISKLAYPIIDFNVNYFKDILPILNDINGFEKSKNLIKNKKNISPKEYAIILSTLCTEFYNKPIKVKTSFKRVKIKSFEEWENKHEDKKFLQSIYTIKGICQNLDIVGFYLHGSLSTLDYIKGWSDADTLMILKEGTIKDAKKLINLRKQTINIVKNLFKIDQHHLHGCFIISEEEMQIYPQTFFPLEILNYSTLIHGADNLNFKLRDDKLERKNCFVSSLKYFENAYLNNPKHILEWKKFYHTTLMLPTIYFQVKGKHFYKKNSFESIKEEFNQKELIPLKKATWIMNNWLTNNWYSYIIKKSIFPSPFIIIILAKYQRLFKKIKFLNPSLIEESYKLAIIMKEKLQKENYL